MRSGEVVCGPRVELDYNDTPTPHSHSYPRWVFQEIKTIFWVKDIFRKLVYLSEVITS